jgi:ABC-type transport system involved in multi-copper enzyme maturation permease subunit
MIDRVRVIAANTFREAVRDRVLYNLIVFALIMVASALVFGQISFGIERLIMVNLGLTAITAFGVVIAIFIGIGLVSKEIEKKTLYTVLSRPVRRWEFIVGKFFGLSTTLFVNTLFMAIGFFAALWLVVNGFERSDVWIFAAVWFIVLEFVIVTAVALLFSSFSSPLLSAVFTLALFVIGNFAQDLRSFGGGMKGLTKWVAVGVAHIVPNFASFNIVSSIAHGEPLARSLILWNTGYAILYSAVAVSAAVIIFENRNLK